jgi:hypothetical protein
LREESENIENLKRINLILSDRIKKLEEMEFDTAENEVIGKAKEKMEKLEQKIAQLSEERRKFRK